MLVSSSTKYHYRLIWITIFLTLKRRRDSSARAIDWPWKTSLRSNTLPDILPKFNKNTTFFQCARSELECNVLLRFILLLIARCRGFLILNFEILLSLGFMLANLLLSRLLHRLGIRRHPYWRNRLRSGAGGGSPPPVEMLTTPTKNRITPINTEIIAAVQLVFETLREAKTIFWEPLKNIEEC